MIYTIYVSFNRHAQGTSSVASGIHNVRWFYVRVILIVVERKLINGVNDLSSVIYRHGRLTIRMTCPCMLLRIHGPYKENIDWRWISSYRFRISRSRNYFSLFLELCCIRVRSNFSDFSSRSAD